MRARRRKCNLAARGLPTDDRKLNNGGHRLDALPDISIRVGMDFASAIWPRCVDIVDQWIPGIRFPVRHLHDRLVCRTPLRGAIDCHGLATRVLPLNRNRPHASRLHGGGAFLRYCLCSCLSWHINAHSFENEISCLKRNHSNLRLRRLLVDYDQRRFKTQLHLARSFTVPWCRPSGLPSSGILTNGTGRLILLEFDLLRFG